MSVYDTSGMLSYAGTTLTDETQPLVQLSLNDSTSPEMTSFKLDPLEITQKLNSAFEEAKEKVKLSNLSEEDKIAMREEVNKIYDFIDSFVNENEKNMVEVNSYLNAAGIQWIEIPKKPWLVDSINFLRSDIESSLTRLEEEVLKKLTLKSDKELSIKVSTIQTKWLQSHIDGPNLAEALAQSYTEYIQSVVGFVNSARYLLKCLEASRFQESATIALEDQLDKAKASVLSPWSLGFAIFGAWHSEGLIPVYFIGVVFSFFMLGFRVLLCFGYVCWNRFVFLKLKTQIRAFEESITHLHSKRFHLEEIYKSTKCYFFLGDFRAKFENECNQVEKSCKAQLDGSINPEVKASLQSLINDYIHYMRGWVDEFHIQLKLINSSASMLQEALKDGDTSKLNTVSCIKMNFDGVPSYERGLSSLRKRLTEVETATGSSELTLNKEAYDKISSILSVWIEDYSCSHIETAFEDLRTIARVQKRKIELLRQVERLSFWSIPALSAFFYFFKMWRKENYAWAKDFTGASFAVLVVLGRYNSVSSTH